MKKLRLVLLLLVPLSALAQSGTRYDNIVIDQHGEAVAFANIRVCSAGSINVPCTPTTNTWNNLALSGAPNANPFQADQRGNFHFYAPCGLRYTVQISAPTIVTYTMPDQLIPCSGGGGGGGYDTIQNAGVALVQRTTLNFLGSGVTCADNPGLTKTDCTITGGGSSAGWLNGGNSFSSSVPSIGNLNNKSMAFMTNALERFRITNGGVLAFNNNAGGITIQNTGATGGIFWPFAYTEEFTNGHGQSIGIGDGVEDHFTFTLRQFPVAPNSVSVFVNHVIQGTDNGAGVLSGVGISSGTINYNTGAIDVTFNTPPANMVYVDIVDTVTRNFIAGSASAHSMVVLANDTKINGAVGAEFATLNHLDLATEGSGDAGNAALGAIKLFGVSDFVNPIGLKDLHQKDSAGNERVFCYTDTCPSNSEGLFPDLNLHGGFVGGWLGAAVGTLGSFFTNQGAAANTEAYLPDVWLWNLSGAVAANQNQTSYKMWLVKNNLLTFPGWSQSSTSIPPEATAGAYQSKKTLLFFNSTDQASVRLDLNGASPTSSLLGWTAAVVGSTDQPLGNSGMGLVVTAGADAYTSPVQRRDVFVPTDTETAFPIPCNGTLNKLNMFGSGSQPGTGTLTLTIDVGAFNSTTASGTALTLTVGASSAAGNFWDTTHSVAVVAGDWFVFHFHNNAAGNSITVGSVGVNFVPDAPCRGILGFGVTYSTSLNAAAHNYLRAHVNTSVTTTETDWWTPIPEDVILYNAKCFISTAPTTADTNVFFQKNGTPQAGPTVNITPATPLGVVDGSGTGTWEAGTVITADFNTGAAFNPLIEHCTVALQNP